MFIYIISTGKESENESAEKGADDNDESEPTIIQIPENLLPMFLPKNNPVKLGRTLLLNYASCLS